MRLFCDMYNLKDYKIKPQPVILAIESSCDETACAIIRGRQVLADRISSSASTQALYGGVVPEIASRAHTDAVGEVVRLALSDAGLESRDIDAVAVTYGAGLLGALLVGLSFAKSFAYALNIPLIAVNHIRGHIAAAYLEDTSLEPPFITLLASGGHTAILRTLSYSESEVLGSTCDDAAGEAFDKVARVLSLPYPGGPNVQKMAEGGNFTVPLPSALIRHGDGMTFSYSGLKTAVINYCHTLAQKGQEVNAHDVAASFQKAALDPLALKAVESAEKYGIKTITAGGGVVANDYLRNTLSALCAERGIKLVLPAKRRCTDNACMIAAEGLNMYLAGNFAPMSVNARAAIPLR